MKILLTTLNSKYIHANLALRYLHHVAEETGIAVTLQEFTINNEPGYVYGEILRGEYDLVCFSCYIWNIESICRLGRTLKQANPALRILLGGPEVSYDTQGFMTENPWVDYVIRGEGELPFSQFCQMLMQTGGEPMDVAQIQSFSFRADGAILETEDAPPLSAAQIPFPYRLRKPEPDKVVYYESARGCPYRCSYCLSSLEKTVRTLPFSRVCTELSYFLQQNVRQVKFIDRTFNCDKQRARDIWQFLMDHDNGVTNFHFEICAELLDEDCLSLLAGARKGLFQFEIGIQTTNARTLSAICRSAQTADLLQKIARLISLGNCHIHVDLIAGLAYEDYDSFADSFNRVYALGADNLQLGFLKLLKGTSVRREAQQHGYLFRAEAPYEVIANAYLSAQELVRLKMIEHVLDLYANKGGFSQALAFLCTAAAETAFQFYETLSAWFYEKGYQHRSHKKEDLYRILYAFAKEMEQHAAVKTPDLSAGVKELLAADLAETMNFDAVKKFHKKGWNME